MTELEELELMADGLFKNETTFKQYLKKLVTEFKLKHAKKGRLVSTERAYLALAPLLKNIIENGYMEKGLDYEATRARLLEERRQRIENEKFLK